MKYNIRLNKTENSKLSEVDFDNIPFGKVFSDHMFVAEYKDGEWKDMRIEPFGYFEVHPACLALHYGQAIFEGMKASADADGNAYFLRPEKHVERLNNSARRLCMPEFPEEAFLQAVHGLVDLDKEWIPKAKGSALYVRPFMFANGEFLGVRPSDSYKFIIFTGPVGPYYPKPVSLLAETKYIRAAEGGIGEAKAAGNYSASLLPAREAIEKGYDQILWLDAKEFKYIQEVGTMNIFFVIDGKVITPAAGGTILKGITRDTVVKLLNREGYEVEERPITIDEVAEAHKNGTLQECFGTGTAAVVAHVHMISYNGEDMDLPAMETRKVGIFVKDTIDGLRNGTIEDKEGWVVPVKALETV
jgi:branched-chain amino acid aminotransferase